MRGLATIVFYLAFAPLSPALMAQDAPPEKRGIGQFLAPACQRIADHANNFPAQQIQLATQYYTPLFRPGPDGKLRPEDRRSCLNVEGACLVGDYLYDTANRSGIQRSTVPYKFGQAAVKVPITRLRHWILAERSPLTATSIQWAP